MSTSIGMMDPAYFVGRKEILDWLNGYLGLSISKVEETCSGAVACQLVDSLFPGKVPMSKVNWEARSVPEYVNNYKVLQSAFDRLHIDKHIDVQRLTRGKYMDNLEFMQWFKNFHDTTGAAGGYDPIERRSKGRGGAKYGGAAAGRRAPTQTATRTSRPAAGGASSSATASVAAASTRAPAASSLKSRAAPARAAAEPDPQLLAKIDELTQERDESVITMAAVEKERDFYFDKLRDIELLFQNHEQESGESELTKNAFKILYATDEEHEEGQEGLEGRDGGEVLDAERVQGLVGGTENLLADDQEGEGTAAAGVDLLL